MPNQTNRRTDSLTRISGAVHRLLRTDAARLGVTMRQYLDAAIIEKANREADSPTR